MVTRHSDQNVTLILKLLTCYSLSRKSWAPNAPFWISIHMLLNPGALSKWRFRPALVLSSSSNEKDMVKAVPSSPFCDEVCQRTRAEIRQLPEVVIGSLNAMIAREITGSSPVPPDP